jgi:hypothetical protein
MSVCGCVRPLKAPTEGTNYTLDVAAGPIWDQEDAAIKCPAVCAAHGGTWNGQWTTIAEGEMSVCGCVRVVP